MDGESAFYPALQVPARFWNGARTSQSLQSANKELNLNYDIIIQVGWFMSHGGARKGAGRPRGTGEVWGEDQIGAYSCVSYIGSDAYINNEGDHIGFLCTGDGEGGISFACG